MGSSQENKLRCFAIAYKHQRVLVEDSAKLNGHIQIHAGYEHALFRRPIPHTRTTFSGEQKIGTIIVKDCKELILGDLIQ